MASPYFGSRGRTVWGIRERKDDGAGGVTLGRKDRGGGLTYVNLFPFISDNFFVVGDIMVSEGEM
jgi:hypothetical protein